MLALSAYCSGLPCLASPRLALPLALLAPHSTLPLLELALSLSCLLGLWYIEDWSHISYSTGVQVKYRYRYR